MNLIIAGSRDIDVKSHFLSQAVHHFKLKPDIIIASDDGINYWRDAALAIDMDFPMIVVNHPCSEEFGMENLAAHLSEKFPAVPVHHIPQKCMYKMIMND